MKILVCPDSFKGTLTAREAAAAIGAGVGAVFPNACIELLPVGDGGEGTVSALAASLPGASMVECETVDPLRRPLRASYMIAGKKAYIESAAASGLTLVSPEERDIMRADTYGTGLLIADAWRRGIRDITVGMGGTATCDGGFGAYEALSPILPPKESAQCRFTLLCDVTNPLCGEEGAARVFGPQKGAGENDIPLLEMKLENLARFYGLFLGMDVTGMRYAGAAGGLAGMLMAVYGARPVEGIGEVLDILGFERRLKGADLLITGEGKADATTLSGKAPSGILRRASLLNVPVGLIAGRVEVPELFIKEGFEYVEQATPEGTDPCEAPFLNLQKAASRLAGSLRRGRL